MNITTNNKSIFFIDAINSTAYFNFSFINGMHEFDRKIFFLTSKFIYDEAVKPPKNTIYYFFPVTTIICGLVQTPPMIRRILKAIEYPFNLLRLLRLIKIYHVGIVHFNFFILPTIENLFLLICKKYHCKVVITVHNVLPHDSGLKYRNAYKKTYNKADFIITLTNYVSNQLRIVFNLDKKIQVVPHGDMNYIFNQVKAKECTTYNKPTIVFLGRISPYKGLSFLIDVLKLVLKKLDILLIVMGNPEESMGKYYQHARRNDVMKNIIWHIGYLDLDDMYKKLANTDIFIFPYSDASQSGGIITAFSLGKPVIIRNVGGLSEMISENKDGYISNSIEDMAEKIIFLLTNKEKYHETINYIKTKRRDKNNWANICPRYVKIYSDLSD